MFTLWLCVINVGYPNLISGLMHHVLQYNVHRRFTIHAAKLFSHVLCNTIDQCHNQFLQGCQRCIGMAFSI